MANKKITEMTPADVPLVGTEKVPIVQSGQNKECSAQDIADLGGGSIADASPTVKGKAKLFTSTGSGTDGAMDQNSVTTALAGKDAAGAASSALTSANSYTDTQIATEVTNRNSAITSAVANKVSISGAELHATASGTNTYTATLSPAPTYASGLTIRIKFTNGNTGASTINLNSLGAKGIKKNVSSDLASGDIPAGAIIEMVYDGTNFQAIGIFTAVGATWGSITGTLSTQSDLNTALGAKVAKAGDTMTGNLAFGGTQKNTGLAAGTAAGDSLRYEQVYLVPSTPSVVSNAFTWDCGGLMTPEADVSLSASATMTMSNIKAGSSGIIRIAIGTASLVNLTFATTGGLTHKTQNTTFTVYPFPLGTSKEYYLTYYTKDGTTIEWIIGVPAQKVIQAACSDELSSLNTGTNKLRFRMPYAMTLTEVRASINIVQASNGPYGGILTIDINKNGTTVLSTKLTIDNNEKTSVTAATPAVISVTSLADDDEIEIDIDQVGDGTACGLKITLIGI